MNKFDIFIDGVKVAYLKRVAHGMPAIFLVRSEDQFTSGYNERQAKGWYNTLNNCGFNVEMKERA